MTNWKKYRLGDITTWKSGGTPPKMNKNFWNGDIPWLSAKTLTSSRISTSNIFITKEGLAAGSKLAKENSLLMLVRGSGLYNDIPIAIVEKPVAFNQDVKSIEVNEEILRPWFMLYWLIGNKALLNTKLEATGIGAGKFDIDIIKDLNIRIPSLKQQDIIINCARCWDDRIELNSRMNQTLEQIAATLFKKYFVDDIDPNNLPEGWSIAKIEDIAEVIDCLHSKKPDRTKNDTGNILLQLDNILDNGLLDLSNNFHITDDDYKKWISRIEVKFGDCVITNVGRSGVTARIPIGVKAAMGRNMTAIRLKMDFQYPGYLITLMTSAFMKAEIQGNLDVGTILNALNVRSIPKLEFYLPSDKKYIDKIEAQLAPIRSLMERNLLEAQTLLQIRDSLLPKLMSGEIDISAIHQNEQLHAEVLS